MDNFKNLEVWKKSVRFATLIYTFTSSFPKTETYGLTSQIRRSAVSISSNIAEGAGRESNKVFRYFLNISYGSSCELETQILIAKNLGFLLSDEYKTAYEKLTEIQKMLYSLRKKVK